MNDPNTSLEGLVAAVASAAARGVWCALPGTVVSYDAATRTADVRAAVMDTRVDEDGQMVATPIAQIPDVPVALLGGGGARVRFPVRAGDSVLLVFCSRSIERYKIRGDAGGPVDPGDDRSGDLSDAIAIPLDLYRAEDEAPAIEFTDAGQIRVGGNEGLVTRAEFMAHLHTAPSGGGPTSTPTVSITGTTILRGAIVLGVALILFLLGGG